MGPPGEAFLKAVIDSASINRLQVETLSASEVYRRYPAFQIPENYAGIFDPQAGWIDVDASIRSSHAHAAALGAECVLDQPVIGWSASGGHVRVELQNETVTACLLYTSFRLCQTAQGNLSRELRPHLFHFIGRNVIPAQSGFRCPRNHGIHPDAEGRVIDRHAAHQRRNGALGSAVSACPARRLGHVSGRRRRTDLSLIHI